MKGWKTVTTGIATVLLGLTSAADAGWTFSPEQIGLIIAGLNGIFSKQHNVSHSRAKAGTKPETVKHGSQEK